MKSIINAISKNDTASLYNMVDTFSLINEKDKNRTEFESTINYLYKHLSKNKIELADNNFVLIRTLNTKRITVLVYRLIYPLPNSKRYDFVTLEFWFNGNVYDTIFNLPVDYHYRKQDDNEIFIAPPISH